MKVFSQQSFLSQLAILTQQRFYDHLDHENEEREAEHRKALTEAAAEHDRVRRSAEQFREQLELQIHIERQREEEVVQEEIERQRKEKLARDEAAKKREIERAQAAELDARKAAEAEKAKVEALEQQRRDKERRDSEIARRLQQERDTQRAQQQERQAAEKQAKAQEAAATTQVSSSAPTAQPSSQLSTTSASSVHETEHARYKQIHKNLKELRKFMTDQARQNAELKNVMGEMRRGIKKSVGQIREGKVKGQNTKQVRLELPLLGVC